MNDEPLFKHLTLTCSMCPVQFEGELSNGMHLYARARSGNVHVGIADTFDDAVGGDDGFHLYGDFYEGYDTGSQEALRLIATGFAQLVAEANS